MFTTTMTFLCLDFMYGPLRFTRTDLVAMTIQRGRDFGLSSYSELRKSLDLPPIATFRDINPELSSTNPQVRLGKGEPEQENVGLNSLLTGPLTVSFSQLLHDLEELYNGDVSKLELFPGGLLESQDGPGPVFTAIILDQFERTRNGDRFWFENRQNG